MKFLHTADLHLINKDTLIVLKNVVGMAKAKDCDAILIAGDMFDKESARLEIEADVIAILESFPGEIVIIPGNHDIEFLSQRDALSNNSRVLNTSGWYLREQVRGIEVIAVPYKKDAELKDLGDIPSDPERSILLVHGSFYDNDYFYDKNRRSYFPVFVEDVRDKFRYVALGHYHRLIKRQYGKTIVVNPGSPRVTKSSDIGRRVVSVVDTDTWKAEVVPIYTDFNEEITLNVSVFDDGEAILARLTSQLELIENAENATLRVMVRGTLSPEIKSPLMLQRVLDDMLNREKVKSQTLDMSGIYQIERELLENPYVKNLLAEISAVGEQNGGDTERLRLMAIERINSLFLS